MVGNFPRLGDDICEGRDDGAGTINQRRNDDEKNCNARSGVGFRRGDFGLGGGRQGKIGRTHCAKCHGADGKGQTKMGQKLGVKDFTDAKVQADMKDDAVTKAIKEGLKDADGKTLMKPFDTLSDDEVKALVAYIHGLKA